MTRKRSTKEELNKNLEEIKRYLVMGFSHNEIARHLEIPLSTFYYYHKMLNNKDKKLLADLKNKTLDHEVIVCKARLERILFRCEQISADATTLPKEKLEAEKLKSQIAIDILRLVRDSNMNEFNGQVENTDTEYREQIQAFFNTIS